VQDELIDCESSNPRCETFVPYADYASLKAEVEVWKDMVADSGVACNERARENQDLENQIERLKAEVERLTSNIQGRDAIIAGLDSIVKCRDKQVERMTLAGDRLCDKEFVETMGDYEFDREAYAIRIRNWHKAKGVQS
jgi:hypothetical protein